MTGQLRESLNFAGLFTNPNELAAAGVGAFREFTNMQLVRPDLATKRRGITRCAINTGTHAQVNKLFNYDGGQLFHCGDGSNALLKKFVPSTGAITAYSGNVVPTSGRLRSCISGKNFMAAGTVPWRLSGLSGTPVAAGGLYAPGFDRLATLCPVGTVFAAGKTVAYRTVFGLTDAKGNLILGEVSSRLAVTTPSIGTAYGLTVRAIIPSAATTNHFIQFYRSAQADAGDTPDDHLQLVFEQQLTALDISNGYLDLTDVVPDALRGATIYTSSLLEGIAATNRAPPGCVEVCDHKDITWYANTTQPGEFLLSILAVGGSLGIQPTDLLWFGGSSALGGALKTLSVPFGLTARRNFACTLDRTSNVVTVVTAAAHGLSTSDTVMTQGSATASTSGNPFGPGPFTITKVDSVTFTYPETGADSHLGTQSWAVYKTLVAGDYLTETTGTASFNNLGTALNFVSAFNKYSQNGELWAQSSPFDLDQGRLLIRGRTAATGAFSVTVGVSSKRDCFSPKLAPVPQQFTLSRTSNVVTGTVATGTHTFAVGESVTIYPGGAGSGGSTFGTGPFQLATVSTTQFTYAETGVGGGANLANQIVTLYPTDTQLAEVEIKPNRVYYSKQQKHEATTRLGFIDIGSADTAILAMKSQRGQIWVWKSDGIYRITGDNPANFDVEAKDTSLRVLATESVQLFANRCWGLTDRGVVAVSESGLEVMSGPITEDLVLMATAVAEAGAASVGGGFGPLSVESDCFATPYESAKSYILHVPNSVALDSSGKFGACRYAYVYTSPQAGSQRPGTWAFWDWGASDALGFDHLGFGKRCALVGLSDDKLYLGDGYNGATGEGFIYQERKTYGMTSDYEDDNGYYVGSVSLTRTGGSTVVGTVASHFFVVGQRIRLPTGGSGFTNAGPFTITAVTPTTFTFTSSGSNVTTTGQTAVLSVPILGAVTTLLLTAGAPGMEKRWDEVEVLFAPIVRGQDFSYEESQVAIGCTLKTEVTSETFAVASQGTQTSRIWVPGTVARGTRLSVRVYHSTPGEVFQLAGIAVKAEVLSGAPSR